MTCRRCRKKFDAVDGPSCPFCGEAQAASKSGVMKSSTILISAGETDAVYRSVKEVPAPLRRKLLKSTNGLNSATILIADRRGREEIARAIQNLPSSLQRRFLKPFREEPEGVRGWLMRPPVKAAIAWLLGAGSVATIWLVFRHPWF
jgi:hypothetical protein